MKSFFRFFVAPYFLIICLLVGCSDDDAAEGVTEIEFLSAQVDGEDFVVDRSVGFVSCKKQLNDYGGIDLLVKTETKNGEIMEIFVTNYTVPKSYIFSYDGYSKGWMRYGLVNPLGDWFAVVENRKAQTAFPFIEILEDNGEYVKGNFSFRAHNTIDNSIKMVSNGNFNFRLDSELD